MIRTVKGNLDILSHITRKSLEELFEQYCVRLTYEELDKLNWTKVSIKKKYIYLFDSKWNKSYIVIFKSMYVGMCACVCMCK